MTTTLRLALTQLKPTIPCNETPGTMKNSFNAKWPTVKSVKLWSEFVLPNLLDAHGPHLSQSIHAFPRTDEELEGKSIDGLDGTKFLTRWNCAMMASTLDNALSGFPHLNGTTLSHQYSNIDRPLYVESIGLGGPRASADHLIELDGTHSERQRLVVGLGKPSSRFSMKDAIHRDGTIHAKQTKHLFVPRQLANLCVKAGTLYGYIQTDKELVACHFTEAGGEYGVYVMRVPWSDHGSERLTTDLALWWLCMKALSVSFGGRVEGHTAATVPEVLSRVNEEGEDWDEEPNDDTSVGDTLWMNNWDLN
ncbi:hypothetical protein M426DRAFT_12058 [Hypoxylon sp. CI-4A]|nr:hypothetical protein M426DRAFT_12058 [Hypoxylon sp. CI-4A]